MDDLSSIKGVGPKIKSSLSKLNIENTNDLINFYPFRYEVLIKSNIDSLNQDDKIIIDGILEGYATVTFLRNRKDRMKFVLNTGRNLINVCIFNRGFLKTRLIPRTKVIVIGKYDKKNNTIVASDIRFGVLTEKPIIEPIYHTVSGITSKKINELIKKIAINNIDDYIPDEFINKYKFLDKETSLIELHNPSELNKLKMSLARFKYEELFLFMVKMKYLQNSSKNTLGLKKNIDFKLVEEFINNLDFKLTLDQEKAIKDIYNDFISKNQMNRLLQGDVGSGKSIVSFASLFMNYLSNYQGCIMAPTEILAEQHYNELLKLFKKYNIKVCLVTGSLKAKERKEILSKIKNNEYDVIVGTHALFSSDVEYYNLGLVITDEQHRFGVKQRSNLKNKGVTPDILYMSATPIPRTYALTIYGDMDITNIKTMPSGRKEIITRVIEEKNIKEVLELMYEQLKLNHQIYVVSPLIEESENSNLKDIERLSKNMEKAFGSKYKIDILHGKMAQNKKNEVMELFKNKKIDILVSTTVIEVGVNVPNATMIVIFDSQLFGLSALHQLRGRVGRGDFQSYCILVSASKTKRLEILENTTDGFKISEEDFKLRGSGDLFGIRQSGGMEFKIADIKKDFPILLKAKEDSEEFINSSMKEKYPKILDLVIKEHLD